jgi:transcriptional regulator with XRE-family HTH domain
MPLDKKKLITLRKAAGYTQQTFADALKMHQQAYARIESPNGHGVNFETAENIANLLGVSLDELRTKSKPRRK